MYMEEKSLMHNLEMHNLIDRPYTDKGIEDMLKRLNSLDENGRPKQTEAAEE